MKLQETGRNLAVLLMIAGLSACGNKVPNLVGMTEKEAQDALAKAKLKPGKITEVHGRGAAGKVVEQDPAAGAKPSGETVAMMIEGAAAATTGASASPGIAVPDLSGKTLSEAEVALAALGLVRGEIRLAAVDKPPGTVFDEDPHAGTQTQPGATVDLSIATGTLPVTVPNAIIGQTQAAAEQMLRDAGLQIGAIAQDTKPDAAPNNTVVGSNPSVGVQVAKGTPVGLVLKQPAVVVPHVVTLAQDTAKVRLLEAGLQPVVNTVFDASSQEGTVTWQSMDNVPVAKGTTIGIKVATHLRVIRFPYVMVQNSVNKQVMTSDQFKVFKK